MDSQDLFRKLSSGAKFNFKRFKADARKLQLIKPPPPPKEEEFEEKVEDLITEDSPEIDFESNIKKEEEEEQIDDDQCDEVTIIGTKTSSDQAPQPKKKKSKAKNPLSEKAKAIQQKEEEIRHFRNLHGLNVVGTRIPPPVRSFASLLEDYKVSKIIISNLEKCGYEEPTPIQMQAIPIMLEKRQILACAPTGSGKTAAFLVPILNDLGGPLKKGFRAVIICPTRELARQTFRETLLLSEGTGLRIRIISKAALAAASFGPQSAHKFDVLVTTPNRLIYLLQQEPPAIELKAVEWLIVDESDKLFEPGTRGFRDQLAAIFQACDSKDLRRAMFSATHMQDVAKWARRNLKHLITVTVGMRNSACNLVEQKLLFVGNEAGKLLAFRNLVREGLSPPVLVFVQSKVRAKELFTELIYDGINVDVINADRTQTQRDNVVRCFREGKIWVLICTELMGRGIDFKGVNLVINYDFPPTAVAYIHRIGRTGRAGRPGKAVTFFTLEDTVNLRSIARVMKDSGCDVPDYMLGIKKLTKRERQRQERSAPEREQISTIIPSDQRRLDNFKQRIKKRRIDAAAEKKQVRETQLKAKKRAKSDGAKEIQSSS